MGRVFEKAMGVKLEVKLVKESVSGPLVGAPEAWGETKEEGQGG